MVNMFAAFAGAGALAGVGQGMMHERNLQESLDASYQQQTDKTDAAKLLQDNASQDKERERLAEINAKKNQASATDKELVGFFDATQQGKVPLNIAGSNTSPTAGVPSDMGGDDNSPITPRTQPVQTPAPPQNGMPPVGPQSPATAPQGQAHMPQQQGQPPAAPAPAQGGLNSPQGGPVPITPQEPPAAVDPNTPAAQITAQTAVEHAAQVKQAGGTDSQAFIAGLPGVSPQFKGEWGNFATANGITDANDLQYLMRSKKDFIDEGKPVTDWYKDVVNPFLANKEKNAKTSVDTTQWGSEDVASISAMKREGLLGDETRLKPLTSGQKKDNDQLVQQAYQLKTAATQGIGTFQRIVQDVSKINPGPGSDAAAYVKNTWAQMTGSQRSQALTTFFEGQKESVNALNAQINTMRQAGGRFVVGANVLAMEKQGIPDITKMTPEASLALAQGYINNYKQMIGQADAIMSTPDEISPNKRIQFANKYAESNPTFGPDAQTPNPTWKEFKDWRDGGTQSQITGASNRAGTTNDAASALADAKAGGKGEVAHDPNIAAIHQGLPAGAKVTKISK